MKFSKVLLDGVGSCKHYGGNCAECGAKFVLALSNNRFPQIQCPSCQAITHIDYTEADLRLILRVGRQIKLRTMGKCVNYHIRDIVDEDQVVVRHYDFGQRKWVYEVFGIDQWEKWYRNGRLS